MRSRLPHEADQGRAELASMLAAKVDNDGSMVVVTDPVPRDYYSVPGKWDVDEPAPVTVKG